MKFLPSTKEDISNLIVSQSLRKGLAVNGSLTTLDCLKESTELIEHSISSPLGIETFLQLFPYTVQLSQDVLKGYVLLQKKFLMLIDRMSKEEKKALIEHGRKCFEKSIRGNEREYIQFMLKNHELIVKLFDKKYDLGKLLT